MLGISHMPQRVFGPENGGNPGNVNIAGQVTETLLYTSDVQARRQAWSELANELGIDESLVFVTSTGINIQGIANFELNDSEDASYDELEKGKKGGLTNVPEIEIWERFESFMSKWTRIQKETFLTQVMKMNMIKKGGWNIYRSRSLNSNGFSYGLHIHKDEVKTDSYLRNLQYSVRRVKN